MVGIETIAAREVRQNDDALVMSTPSVHRFGDPALVPHGRPHAVEAQNRNVP
jgi:hypothetical protein